MSNLKYLIEAITEQLGYEGWHLENSEVITTKVIDMPLITLRAKELQDESDRKTVIEGFKLAIETLLDTKAKESGFDSILSARSYAGYFNPFQILAQALAMWASDCWVVAGGLYSQVGKGNAPIPTNEEVLTLLPTLELP